MRDTVFIHTNQKQRLGALVSAYSLKARSREPDAFDVRILWAEDYPVHRRARRAGLSARGPQGRLGSRTTCSRFRRSASTCRASWATRAARS